MLEGRLVEPAEAPERRKIAKINGSIDSVDTAHLSETLAIRKCNPSAYNNHRYDGKPAQHRCIPCVACSIVPNRMAVHRELLSALISSGCTRVCPSLPLIDQQPPSLSVWRSHLCGESARTCWESLAIRSVCGLLMCRTLASPCGCRPADQPPAMSSAAPMDVDAAAPAPAKKSTRGKKRAASPAAEAPAAAAAAASSAEATTATPARAKRTKKAASDSPATAAAAAPATKSKRGAAAGSSSSSSSGLSASSLATQHHLKGVTGEVFSMGSGDCSQLGLGPDEEMRERKHPTKLTVLDKSSTSVIAIAAGSLHNLVLTSKHAVQSWGCNDDFALGRVTDEWLPEPVAGPLGKGSQKGGIPVAQIACGASHSVALTEDGDVYAFGTFRDANGVIGFSETVEAAKEPMLMHFSTKSKIAMIAAGEHHDLALTVDGEVFQWGDIGIGRRFSDRKKKTKLTPSRVLFKKSGSIPAPKKLVRVYAGGHCSYALDENGQAWFWGPNNYSREFSSSEPPGKRLRSRCVGTFADCSLML